MGRNAFSSFGRSDAITNVAPAQEQRIVQIMSDIDRSDDFVSPLIQAKEGRFGNETVSGFLYFQTLQVHFKIMIVSPGNGGRDDFFAGTVPFVQHIGNLFSVLAACLNQHKFHYEMSPVLSSCGTHVVSPL